MYFLLAFILSLAFIKAQIHSPINQDFNELLSLLFDPSDSSNSFLEPNPFGMRFSDDEDDSIVVPKPFKAVIRPPKQQSKQIVLRFNAIRPPKGARIHPDNIGSDRKQLQIVRKEEPFFRSKPRGSKKNYGEASRRIESKAFAEKYFSDRRPTMKAASSTPKKNERTRRGPHRMMMSRIKNCRECKPGERVWKVQRVIIQPPMNEGQVWTWKAQGTPEENANKRTLGKDLNMEKKKGKPKKFYSTRSPKKGKHEKPLKRIPDGYGMSFYMKKPSPPPSFPEYAKKRKPVEDSDSKHDPLESPWIRMAVAIALGALVTCGVYAIASIVCMIFPGFFGSNDDDILGSGGRPVRYVPVPVIQEKKVETVTMV